MYQVVILIRSGFDDNINYPQVFLEECLYKLCFLETYFI